MNEFVDVVTGKMALIADSQSINIMSNYRKFADREVKDDWTIAYQMKYIHEYKIVNIKHPKHKQIVKLINISVEHGITVRRSNLIKHGFLLFFYLIEKFVHPKVVNLIKRLMHKKHDKITINEFSSVIMLYLFILFISAIIFIMEIIYYKIKCFLARK